MAAPAATSYWSQDANWGQFSGAKADGQRAPVLTPTGLPFRGEWGEASPAVGVLQSFRAPPNEFETENLILLELSLENQSNYFLLPFVEYSYNCITVNGVRIHT